MADLRSDFIGIKSPNPFWLASAPPTDKEYNVRRAFEAGWGGVVWKTLGSEGPPIVNVNGPRYGAVWGADRRLLGLNNIELITDRPLEVNLREIKQVKRDWPDRAMIISLMVPCDEDSWKDILSRIEDTGADGVELNFGCPLILLQRNCTGCHLWLSSPPRAPGAPEPPRLRAGLKAEGRGATLAFRRALPRPPVGTPRGGTQSSERRGRGIRLERSASTPPTRKHFSLPWPLRRGEL
jgi:hypothetical protein